MKEVRVLLRIDDDDVGRQAIIDALPAALGGTLILEGSSRWDPDTRKTVVTGTAVIDEVRVLR